MIYVWIALIPLLIFNVLLWREVNQLTKEILTLNNEKKTWGDL